MIMTLLKKLLWPIKLLLLIGPLCTNAQTSVIINGRVIDNKNNSLQKVTVGVKGESVCGSPNIFIRRFQHYGSTGFGKNEFGNYNVN